MLLMLGVGGLVGFRFAGGPVSAAGAVALLVLVGAAFSWVGVIIALMLKSVDAAQEAGFVWIFPLLFASSAFVPVATMPSWLRTFAETQPVTAAVNAVRFLTSGGAAPFPASSDVAACAAWVVGITTTAVPIAIALYRRRA